MAQHPISENSRLFHKFTTCRTAFMLCDVQEKVEPHISNYHDAVHAANAMAAMHALLGPSRSVFIVSEQYPKGVGHTHHSIRLPADAVVSEKMTPSMLVPKVRPYIFGDAAQGIEPVQQVIIWGHETYGCVLTTIDELLSHGIRVAILVDGCGSQVQSHHDIAIEQMSHWEGLLMSTVPSVLMQLTRSDPLFVKEMIKIYKQYFADWASTQPRPEVEASAAATTAAAPPDGNYGWSGMKN